MLVCAKWSHHWTTSLQCRFIDIIYFISEAIFWHLKLLKHNNIFIKHRLLMNWFKLFLECSSYLFFLGWSLLAGNFQRWLFFLFYKTSYSSILGGSSFKKLNYIECYFNWILKNMKKWIIVNLRQALLQDFL